MIVINKNIDDIDVVKAGYDWSNGSYPQCLSIKNSFWWVSRQFLEFDKEFETKSLICIVNCNTMNFMLSSSEASYYISNSVFFLNQFHKRLTSLYGVRLMIDDAATLPDGEALFVDAKGRGLVRLTGVVPLIPKI